MSSLNVRKLQLALVLAGLAGAAAAEDGFNTSWGEGWRVTAGGAMNGNMRTKMGIRQDGAWRRGMPASAPDVELVHPGGDARRRRRYDDSRLIFRVRVARVLQPRLRQGRRLCGGLQRRVRARTLAEWRLRRRSRLRALVLPQQRLLQGGRCGVYAHAVGRKRRLRDGYCV